MRADLRAVIVEVGRFLGGRFEANAGDAHVLGQVLEHSSFASMSQHQERWCSPRPAHVPPFVRKGVVGDWESHFSAEQAQRLVERFEAHTAGTWMADLWPEIMAKARARGSV